MTQALKHYGILGMKWGVRRTPEQLGHRTARKEERAQKKAEKREARAQKKAEKREAKQAAEEKRRKDAYDKMTPNQKKYYDGLTDSGRDEYFAERYWFGQDTANATLMLSGAMGIDDYVMAAKFRESGLNAINNISQDMKNKRVG